MIKLTEKYAKLDTEKKTLLLRLFPDNVSILHFGDRINDSRDYAAYDRGGREVSGTNEADFFRNLISHAGEGGTLETSVIVCDGAGDYHTRLHRTDTCILEGDLMPPDFPHAKRKAQTLCITMTDEVRGYELRQYISIFDDTDAFVFRTSVTNLSGAELHVRRLMSAQLDFYGDSADILTYDGAWARERYEHRHTVSHGIFVCDSKCGFSSSKHNPFVCLQTPEDGVIGANLIYSSNHKEAVECDGFGRIRFLCGMNDYMTDYELKKGECLDSPECVIAHGADMDEMTHCLHRFTMRHIVRDDMAAMERPVLANNWEATYFHFTREKLLDMAERAHDIGVELFVLDDGWFGHRDNDRTSLGDWFDYTEKTGGIANLADCIRAKGVKFGLWVEPEMISEDSELYRAHPEYAMKVPGYTPLKRRNQLVLDLVNPEVREYLINTLTALFEEVKPEYVKWDCNRNFTDVYSPILKNQGEYCYKYMVSLYKLLYEIMERFPNILFEGCASGGNRFDLGIAYFFPQSWCSDNTDARTRFSIQTGTFTAYPQSLAGSHVSASPNHQTGDSTSLEDRFNIAAAGAFGYELDLTACTEQELATMKEQIEFYKQHRRLLQFGDMSRLSGEYGDEGWIVVSEDGSEAMATVVSTEFRNVHQKRMFRLKGLDKNAVYTVTERKQENQKEPPLCFEAGGDTLLTHGMDLGNIYLRTDRRRNSNSIATSIFYLKKVR